MSNIEQSVLETLENVIDAKIEKASKTDSVTKDATVASVNGDDIWVKISGNDFVTPVTKSTVTVQPGELVTVTINNGVATITGNKTSLAVTQSSAEKISASVVNATLEPMWQNIRELNLEKANIDDLTADNVVIKGQLTAANGYINQLYADNAVISGNLNAAVGRIDDLEANSITTTYLEANYIDADTINSTYLKTDISNSNVSWITNGTIANGAITNAMIFSLSANKLTAGTIDASKINVANLNAKNLIVEKVNGQPVIGGYITVTVPAGNPSESGYYELVNGNFSLSEDVEVDENKTYYINTGNSVAFYDQNYIDNLETNLSDRIDKSVETWNGSDIPTMANGSYPVSTWGTNGAYPTNNQLSSHVGDIYYVVSADPNNTSNGFCYRFAYDRATDSYDWVLIKDSDVTKALHDIGSLQTFELTTNQWKNSVDGDINSIKQNHTTLTGIVDKTLVSTDQLWYTGTLDNPPSKPLVKVDDDNSSDQSGQWTNIVPTYDPNAPVYYYCWQYNLADKTTVWSDPVEDKAMTETQGVSRSARDTAGAALPATTYNTFIQNTFKDVSDSVSEHSTTITKMTETLQQGGRNLLTEGKVFDTDSAIFEESTVVEGNSKVDEVQEYICSGGNSIVVLLENMVPSSTYTLSFSAATHSNYLESERDIYVLVAGESEVAGSLGGPDEWVRLSRTFTATGPTERAIITLNGEYQANGPAGTHSAAFREFKLERGMMATPWDYSNEEIETISQTVSTVKQTADGNESRLDNLTQILGTNEDGTSKEGDITRKYSALVQNLEGFSTTVGTLNVKVNGKYAVSNSGKELSNKTATVNPTVENYSLYVGETVTVRFVEGNSAVNPTISINGTTATPIKSYTGAALTQNEAQWPADATLTFMYDGSAWLMQDQGATARLSAAETTIQQTANNVLIKATSTGATNSETNAAGDSLVGLINVSSSDVLIEAENVNIAGAAIFTGNGRLSESSLNTTIQNKIPTSLSSFTNDSGFINDTQYIYKSISEQDYQMVVAGTLSMPAPGAWVQSSSGNQNEWTTKRPTYSSSYPILFVARQTKIGNTVTTSTPVKDDTTTVIDGGHITTGTIDASQVTVTNINANSITSGILKSVDNLTYLNLDIAQLVTTKYGSRIGTWCGYSGRNYSPATLVDGKNYCTKTTVSNGGISLYGTSQFGNINKFMQMGSISGEFSYPGKVPDSLAKIWIANKNVMSGVRRSDGNGYYSMGEYLDYNYYDDLPSVPILSISAGGGGVTGGCGVLEERAGAVLCAAPKQYNTAVLHSTKSGTHTYNFVRGISLTAKKRSQTVMTSKTTKKNLLYYTYSLKVSWRANTIKIMNGRIIKCSTYTDKKRPADRCKIYDNAITANVKEFHVQSNGDLIIP